MAALDELPKKYFEMIVATAAASPAPTTIARRVRMDMGIPLFDPTETMKSAHRRLTMDKFIGFDIDHKHTLTYVV